ncbi:MAG: hypothetical protein JNK15_19680 [Planctomycetes bacterium]|nr:hypothetical protein [Planctomycetota bacterium]
MVALIVVLIVGIAITAAVLSWRAEQKRRAELEALARELGLRFDPADDSSHDDEYAQFEIFRRGHSRVARNTLRGRLDLFGTACELVMGDFRYKVTRSNGKSSSTTTYRFSYLIVHPPWPSPTLLVRREGLWDKVKGAFGFDDIDFESAEFSGKYFVQSNDKRFAYDVLHPRMMEFLLASSPPMLDLEGGALCVGDGSRRWEPAGFRRQIEFVRNFCALWPRHLTKDLGS